MLTTFALSAQKKEIEVGDFTKVSFGVAGQLYIKQGNENKLVIDANQAAWEKLEVVRRRQQT